MNERIRECWLKAAREDAGETWDSQEQFIERFAELIVKECAQLVDDHDPTGWIEGIVLQHFGVE